jgi:ABC-2 type transport system permease protein
MTTLWALVKAKLQISWNTVLSVRRQSRLKVLVITLFATGLWLGGYGLAAAAFRFLEDLGAEFLGLSGVHLGTLLVGRLLALFCLALLAMLFFSNAVVTFATLYRSQEMMRLIHSPVTWRNLFLGRFAECVAFSSWSTAYVGSPLLLAYGVETQASALFYLALPLFYLPFVVIPAALGAFATIVLVRLLAPLSRGPLLALGTLAVTIVFLLVFPSLRTEGLTESGPLLQLLEILNRPQSPWLPSTWVAAGLLASGAGQVDESLFYLLLLAANAAFFTWIATEAAHLAFYPGWSSLAGSPRGRPRPLGRSLAGPLGRLLVLLPEPQRSLTIKDLRLFWRDPAQWSQFLVFFGVMALYVVNMRQTSSAYDSELWKTWITLLNLAASMLILATLTTRFVFPLVSLEGRRWWILGLSPITLRQLVWQKLWVSCATTSALTVGLIALSNLRLGLSPMAFAATVAVVLASNLALSGLAVGLGALYPSFHEDNPARIIAGLGGTLTFLLSVAYIVLVTAAMSAGLTGASHFPPALPLALLLVAILTALAFGLPMALGLRSLESSDL